MPGRRFDWREWGWKSREWEGKAGTNANMVVQGVRAQLAHGVAIKVESGKQSVLMGLDSRLMGTLRVLLF